MKKLIYLFLASLPLLASTVPNTYPNRFQGTWSVSAYVPTASTAICGAPSGVVCGNDLAVNAMVFSNTSASPVTVTVTDNSTLCNSGPCTIFPTVNIAANTTYTVPLYGILAKGGVKWSASSVNAVSGFMIGSY